MLPYKLDLAIRAVRAFQDPFPAVKQLDYTLNTGGVKV